MRTMYQRLLIFAAVLGIALGQDAAPSPQRMTVPFSDPSRPGTLSVNLIRGSVTVRGYDGKDAIIEWTSRGGAVPPGRKQENAPPGMHRIDNGSSGLDVKEENNIIAVRGGPFGPLDLVIQVPAQTTLSLKELTGGDIVVESVSGEVDASNLNGAITITNASGAVLAHTMNGKITVSLSQVVPDKSMSFSTMNGDIDVTLPASAKAKLKMKADRGEIYTDFDMKTDAAGAAPIVEDTRGKNGRYRLRADRSVYASINGGGPEMRFTTYSGRILIHKKN
jgi:hypothetical protein